MAALIAILFAFYLKYFHLFMFASSYAFIDSQRFNCLIFIGNEFVPALTMESIERYIWSGLPTNAQFPCV
jgi:hypothetical protein